MKSLFSKQALLIFIITAFISQLDSLNNVNKENQSTHEEIPLYLSIEVNHDINKRQIFDFLLNNLMILIRKFPQNYQIRSDYEDLLGQRMFILIEPDSWHITTLYIGEDKEKLETDYFKKFEEGKEIRIKLLSFAYIPGRLVSAPVFIDYNLIENKFPHMTLILGGKSRAVDSNYLLKSLFSDNINLRLLYDDGKIKDESFLFEIELDNIVLDYVDIDQKEEFEKVYFIKSKYSVKRMIGKTKKNYE
jgi:hypothetical protein